MKDEVRYGENINKGTGTVTLESIGAYTGTVTKKFKIEARKLSADMLNEAVIKAEFALYGLKIFLLGEYKISVKKRKSVDFYHRVQGKY